MKIWSFVLAVLTFECSSWLPASILYRSHFVRQVARIRHGVEVPGSRSVHWSPKSLWTVQRVAVLVTVYCFCQIPNSKSITFHHNLEYSNLESATILYIILYQHISQVRQVRSNSPVTFRFQRVPAGAARKRWPAWAKMTWLRKEEVT